MEKPALKALVAIVALKVSVVLRVLLVHRDSRERRERKDALVHVVNRESKDLRVTLETAALRVLVVVEQQDHKVHKEFRAPREVEVKLVPGLEAPLVQWDPGENAERWVSKVRRVTQVHLDHRVLLDAMVSRVIAVLLVQWVALVCVDLRVTRV